MRRTLLGTTFMLTTILMSCNEQKISSSEPQKMESNPIQKKSYISIFEIPVTDLSRATNFYQSILDIKIDKVDIPDMQMGLFPTEGQTTFGVLIKGDNYTPSADGITNYLDGGDNLQVVLDKVEKNGGKIITPKTLHGDESGYFAILLDSEGNKIGLHSPN